MTILYILLTIIAVLLEATTIKIPFVLISIVLFFVRNKSSDAFGYAFLFGIVLDILTLRTIGSTSAFLLVFLFIVSLYDRKYEIHTVPFVVLSSFVGSLAYGLLFIHEGEVLISSISVIFATILFVLQRKLLKAINR